MAREELRGLEGVEIGTARGHELHRVVDLTRHGLVARVRRVRREAHVPGVHAAQVREPALGERADQVQRGRGRVVAAHHPLGIVDAGLLGEVEPVDHLAAERGQGHAVAGLVVGRTRLGELPRHAPHLDHGQRRAVREHHGHLQQRAHARGDLVRGGTREGLGAVTTLQEERLTVGHLGQACAQPVHLSRKYEGRDGVELLDAAREVRVLSPLGVLTDGLVPPLVQAGIGRRARGGGGHGSDLFRQGHGTHSDSLGGSLGTALVRSVM